MKTLSLLLANGPGSPQALHKSAYARNHPSKAAAHRYERRRVREYLRHPEAALEEDELGVRT